MSEYEEIFLFSTYRKYNGIPISNAFSKFKFAWSSTNKIYDWIIDYEGEFVISLHTVSTVLVLSLVYFLGLE